MRINAFRLYGAAVLELGAPARALRALGATQFLLSQAEGEGFEPSSDLTARNGFRDRRIRPLCHPSEVRHRVATKRLGYPVPARGEVAEWLKAAPC
jgi:hypothetical protein